MNISISLDFARIRLHFQVLAVEFAGRCHQGVLVNALCAHSREMLQCMHMNMNNFVAVGIRWPSTVLICWLECFAEGFHLEFIPRISHPGIPGNLCFFNIPVSHEID